MKFFKARTLLKNVYTTTNIKDSNDVYVNVMDFYKKAGVYTVLIKVSTFDAKTGVQMNGINQKMEVTIK